jgi:hypothetical protein
MARSSGAVSSNLVPSIAGDQTRVDHAGCIADKMVARGAQSCNPVEWTTDAQQTN